MFRATRKYMVVADRSKEGVATIKDKDGKNIELLIDIDFDKYEHATRVVKVVALPLSKPSQAEYMGHENRLDTEINIGDELFVHHFVAQKENSVIDEDGQLLYFLDHNQIFAKIIDGKLIPIEQFVLCRLIKDEVKTTSSGLILPNYTYNPTQQQKQMVIGKYSNIEAVVDSTPDYYHGWTQLKQGATLRYQKDTDYPCSFNGDDYVFVRLQYILGVFVEKT